MAHICRFHTGGQRPGGFSPLRGPQQDHILAALHERQTGQLPDDLTIDAWLEAEVELLQRFDSWQTSLFQPGFHSALMSAVLFLLQRHAQECRLILG
ncbi:Uncharacterised protein [Salmonella enterica subsp. enterica serovar Daytona]|uniref:Uncharacterized protein n=1 Tax=Salmonella enterica subsp. enterica serovar Daytona TaxID=1962639 RepID=A0A447JMS9_SALET|nr:Uncharacterised protein [Salmonella enterica subsp. enterica serovar Daytona]